MSNAEAMTFDAAQLADAPAAHQPPAEKMTTAVAALAVPVVLFALAVIFKPEALVWYGVIAAPTYLFGILVMCLGVTIDLPSRKRR